MARSAVATAIFAAAVWAWDRATPADTRVAAVAFALTAVVTGAVVWRTELRPAADGRAPRAPDPALAGALAAFDLALATAAVHVTGGGASQFAALYVLAIAGAALTLPFGGAALAAAFGCALYAIDVLWWRPGQAAPGPAALGPSAAAALWLQLATFGLVALAAGWLGARLRAAGAGGEALARALVRARLEAADVLHNMTSGVVTVDAAGRLLYANAAAETLLGVPVRALLGRPVLDQVAAAAPGVAAALGRAAYDGVRTSRAESAVARPAGEGTLGVTTTVGAATGEPPTGAPADDGAGRTATAIFTDITASKRLESLHRRAERLEAVAELAASLAHEIRNPLASIRSAVEQLARLTAAAERARLDGEAAEDARALTGLTLRESDRLSRLLGEFLDFSRARVTQVAPVDVAAVARDAAKAAAAHPDALGVRVVVAPAADALGVDGDAELLHRALFNLVLNGAQATAAHGGAAVRVAVRAAAPSEAPAGADDGVAVEVADDGAGVPAEVAARLFEPFVTTRAGGSGLGLAVVQRAVEAHGGVVLVDAGGGGAGARFTCVLPRAARPAAGPAPRPADPPAAPPTHA